MMALGMWDGLMQESTNVAREVTRKRSEKFTPMKVVPAHGKLVEQARYLSSMSQSPTDSCRTHRIPEDSPGFLRIPQDSSIILVILSW